MPNVRGLDGRPDSLARGRSFGRLGQGLVRAFDPIGLRAPKSFPQAMVVDELVELLPTKKSVMLMPWHVQHCVCCKRDEGLPLSTVLGSEWCARELGC